MNEPQVIAGIQTWIDHDSESASDRVARLIAAQIHDKPDSVLGLATGGTPVGAYRRLIAMNESGEVDFARVTTFNLDEYVGLAGDHPQSYRAFMNTQLFDHVNVAPQRTFVPDGRAADPTAHCQQYESRIRQAGGIDLQLLGLGHNGHIAFNEPGSPQESRTRQVDLTAKTIESNARFFDSIEQVPRHAITMGIATILEARQIVMLVLGEGKAEAVAQMFHGSVGEDFPAAWLREHPRVTVVLDRPAAKLLETSTP